LLAQSPLSPDRSAGQAPHAGRGADAERKGITDVGMWECSNVRRWEGKKLAKWPCKKVRSDPTTLLTRFAEELRRVGQKYEGAEGQADW